MVCGQDATNTSGPKRPGSCDYGMRHRQEPQIVFTNNPQLPFHKFVHVVHINLVDFLSGFGFELAHHLDAMGVIVFAGFYDSESKGKC